MILYNAHASGNCYKVRLMLAHLGLPYEKVELDVIDRSNRKEVLGDRNPDLRVPVLVLDDGRALAESDAILFYLAEGTPWLPEDRFDRAQVLQWMFFEQYSHEPNIAVARFWMSILRKYDPAKLAEKQKGAARALDVLETHLSGRTYLVGERYTIADTALYAYTHVAPEAGLDLSRYPAIRAWLERVADQPGHVAITD